MFYIHGAGGSLPFIICITTLHVLTEFVDTGFPHVVGCIDGTFIRIQGPTENEQDYVNRKGFHSLNVQMTCDANFTITNCVAKWPGSVHDARMFRDSHLCTNFENDECQGSRDYLVSGPRGVPDGNLTASSVYPDYIQVVYKPQYGRLFTANSTYPRRGCWSPSSSNTNEYIQVAFANVKIVTSVLTQGDEYNTHRVTKYKVLYSMDGVTWSTVVGSNTDETFPGNSDRVTVVKNDFSGIIEARFMRINPTEWTSFICLRFDFLGCTQVTEEKNENKQNKWKLRPFMLTASDTQKLNPSPISNIRDLGHCAIECKKLEPCAFFAYDTREATCIHYQHRFNFTVNLTNELSLDEVNYFYDTSKAELIVQKYEFKALPDGSRYYKIYTSKQSFVNSKDVCSNESARPLSVTSMSIMQVIQEAIQKNTILATQTEYFVDGTLVNDGWSFQTGSEIPLSLWGPSEPVSGNRGCVAITGAGLKTMDCSNELFFICEVDIYS